MAVTTTKELLDKFNVWMAEAERLEPSDATAMTLSTALPGGAPSGRMMLLKGADERGFVFYTNLDSRKAHEMDANPRAALTFHWKSLRRQVRIEGAVEPVSEAEADTYFATRSRVSQIGAWASRQSMPLEGRFELEKRIAKYTARFLGGEVPRPDFWSGYRVVPVIMEFWEDRKFRLHERVVYHLGNDGWTSEYLYP